MVSETKYAFRSSAFQKEQSFILTEEGLHIKEEEKSARLIPYTDIFGIKLSHQPSRFKLNNYLCSIIGNMEAIEISSYSYISIGNFREQGLSYSNFVRALVTRIKEVNPSLFIESKPNKNYKLYYLPIGIILLALLFSSGSLEKISASSNFKLWALIAIIFISFSVFRKKAKESTAPENTSHLALPN